MDIRKVICAVIIIAFSVPAIAGSGRGAVISAKSESGKVRLEVELADIDGPVTSAKLTTEQGTIDLGADYDAYAVSDVPNHIITICFPQKGKAIDAPDTRVIKVWAIPSSFVNISTNNQLNWRFKIKVGGSALKEVTVLSGTFVQNP